MMFSAQPPTQNGFPSELDDRDWLAARYQSLGDETVAAELRVSLKAVRRARERLGIDGPVDPPPARTPKRSTNGTSNGSTNGASGGASNGASAHGTFVSDEELARRVGRVKKGLADTCARLVTAIDDLEWVRQQVAPPDRTPSRPRA
jgi:hypothetical protein